MKKMQVNSPEYQKIVNSLLGKETKFEDVPEIPQKETVEKPFAPSLKKITKKTAKKKAVKKKVEKKVEKKNEDKIYLLFKTSEFGNSDDAAYELDYAFRGAYRSKDAALKAAATSIVELGDALENEFFDSETNELLDNVKSSLLKRGWKVLATNVE